MSKFKFYDKLDKCPDCGNELMIRHACAGSCYRYVCRCSNCDNIVLDILGCVPIAEVIDEANRRIERDIAL